MTITNFNLCKTEWLDLVFAKRNKEYGAYYIRQHYADNLVKAMLITFFGVTSIAVITGIAIRTKPVTERIVPVNLNQLFIAPPVTPKVKPPKPQPVEAKATAPKATAPVNTVKNPPMVVAPDPLAIDPPKIDESKATGPVEIKNAGNGVNGEAGVKGGTGIGTDNGTGTGPDADNTEYKFAEVMPQPIGGETAWSKFLQNNLRYPREAMDKEMSGKVFVSFIVEKDGHLSSIKVERGPGYGMDEEAARVLKIAKAWKPGMQNGHPVRVKLTLPVNFSLGY
ncbi:MAG: energy transducer TonB [Bacteroidota bacterium]